MEKTKQPYGTVLIKASHILDFLSSCDEPQSLNIIAKETGLTNSTALKILDTLLMIGYVQKNAELKKFSLGLSIIKYANKSINNLDIKKIAQPHLEELQRVTNETVHLGIQDKDSIIYITKIESKNPICLYSKVGNSIPMYCSAMGKAILAYSSDEEIQNYLDRQPLNKLTNNTITNKSEFTEEILKVREMGYAYDNAEHEEDVFCIGASITLNNKKYGAFSVSIPKYRLTEEFQKQIIEAIQICKNNILNDLH
ncbi:IclR family transcriptional regulator [Priestia endophytica]|uniref:IclR family transcriptional regulator n=1 Tax=Priestia endophytica TaxID=135735 RepID=UPI0022803F83|nr:IclR family transcriptional regulator [Priestia endophytica]MCY8233063.1 IclR family transcriptional regulator [Priestia endophytica]